MTITDAIERAELFSAFSNNCRGSGDDQLYIGHAYIRGRKGTLCGVRIQFIGDPATPDEIGCKRCRRVLAAIESKLRGEG